MDQPLYLGQRFAWGHFEGLPAVVLEVVFSVLALGGDGLGFEAIPGVLPSLQKQFFLHSQELQDLFVVVLADLR